MRATEIDTRMLGMIGALALIWIGFNIYTQIQTGESLFLTPRNLWNLSVQTSSIAIMATGMVLVIVMRHIDLSVGSIIGFVSTIIGVAQVRILPVYLGLDNPAIWILAVVLALAIGAAIGAFHGSLVAYLGIPAFIVTLGAQLFWRGAAWWVTSRTDDRAARRPLCADGRRPARLDSALLRAGRFARSLAPESCSAFMHAVRGARGFGSHSGRCGPNI